MIFIFFCAMANSDFKETRKQLLDSISWENNILQMSELIEDLAFWSKNISGQFILANTLFLKMCQINKLDDLLGKTDFDIWPDHMAENYVKDDQKVIRTLRPLNQKIEPISNTLNSTQFFHTSKFPLYNQENKVVGIVGICKDLKLTHDNVNPVMKMIPIIDFIKENYTKTIDFKKLAEQMEESLEHFRQRFTKLFQINPETYVTKTRITQSLQYANDPDLDEEDIARLVGFENQNDFLNSFKEIKGIDFKTFRNQSSD